jgi:hypothetical protein
MSGLQLTGAIADRLRWALVIGAPAAVSSSTPHGEREFFGRFKDIFLRVATGSLTRGAGLFAFITEPRRIVNGAPVKDNAWRIGLDSTFFIKANQLQAMIMYGEDEDPRGLGKAGTLRGGFIEADRMIKPWLGITARYEVVDLHTTVSRSYQDARTISLRVYPARFVKLAAEYQDLDHGRSTTGFLASISF